MTESCPSSALCDFKTPFTSEAFIVSKKENSSTDKLRRIIGEDVQTEFQQSDFISTKVFEETMHGNSSRMGALMSGLNKEEPIRNVDDLKQRLYYVYMQFMDASKQGVRTKTDLQTVLSMRSLLVNEALFKFNNVSVEFNNEFEDSSVYAFVMKDKVSNEESLRVTLKL